MDLRVRHHPLESEGVEPLVLDVDLAISITKREIFIQQHGVLVVLREKSLELFQLLDIATILIGVDKLLSYLLQLVDLRTQGDGEV